MSSKGQQFQSLHLRHEVIPLNYSCRPTWSLCQGLIGSTNVLFVVLCQESTSMALNGTHKVVQTDKRGRTVGMKPPYLDGSISPMEAWVVTTEQRITQDNRQQIRVKTGCFLDVNLTGLFAPESDALQLPNKHSFQQRLDEEEGTRQFVVYQPCRLCGGFSHRLCQVVSGGKMLARLMYIIDITCHLLHKTVRALRSSSSGRLHPQSRKECSCQSFICTVLRPFSITVT